VIPMPPYSLSPHDIKTFGVRAKPFYLPTKWALSGTTDLSLCLDEESDDGEADRSSHVIPLPPDSFYSQDVRTSFAYL
jgi:hypothetical protein